MKYKLIPYLKVLFTPLGAGVWLFLPIAYCLLSTFPSSAQSPLIKYARSIIDTLAAPGMHGRGYVNKGDSIAADFLKKEFEKIGVKEIGKEFKQYFNIPINTFYGDRNPLFLLSPPFKGFTPGKDYLVSPSSKRAHDTPPLRRTIWLDSTNFHDTKKVKKIIRKANGRYIATDIKNIPDRVILSFFQGKSKPRGFIFIKHTKLTWSTSQTVDFCPSIQLLLSDTSKNLLAIKTNKSVAQMDFYNLFIPNYQSQNIISYIKGTQYPDSFIVFSAHYDHLGRMGKDVYFPGANDNASGCAMLLNLAKYYAEHPPKYSVAFMAFGAEEVGLLGSKHYVENPLFPLKQIKFLVNMDIMGTGDEGIKVVNATEHKKEFDLLLKINEEKKLLPSIQPRGKAKNSDHYYFEEAGVKTFFIYTLGGIKAYHDIYDRPETLPLTKFEETFILLTEFVNTF